MPDSASFTIPGRYDQIRVLCAFVVEQARSAGLDERALFHVELCCDEAATNIIEHAYAGEDMGSITVTTSLESEGFVMRLRDFGLPFNPASVPDPKMPTESSANSAETVDQLQIGGLGIHFMRKLMDDVRYRFSAEEGNVLTLVKHLPQGEAA